MLGLVRRILCLLSFVLVVSSQLGFTINGINQSDLLGGWYQQKMVGGDLNGDKIDDILLSAMLTIVNGKAVGRGYVIFGSSSGYSDQYNLSSLTQSTGFFMNGKNINDQLWYTVSTGDVNGDGIDDIVMGTPFASPNGNMSGQVYVLFGRTNLTYPSPFNFDNLNGSNGFIINGNTVLSYLGDTVSCGDINGDNIADILIGAPGENSHALVTGRGYLIFGKKTPFTGEFDEQSLNGTNGFIINGIKKLDQLGDQASLSGDVNGDKLNDILITSRFVDSNNLNDSGASYVIFGSNNPFPSPFNLTTLNGTNGFTITGSAMGDLSGSTASLDGDVNGDNFSDILIGAFGAVVGGKQDCGKVYIIFGKNTPFSPQMNLNSLNGSNGFTINGFLANGIIGNSATHGGDVNGDKYDDILIGGDSTITKGQAYVLFGNQAFQSQFNLSSCNVSSNCLIAQGQAGELLGYSTSIGGDVNADGVDDIILGAPWAPNGGKCYVIYGRNTAIQDKFPSILNLSNLHSIQQQIQFKYTLVKDHDFSFQISEIYFAKLMGKPNDYSPTGIPSWLNFINSNLTLSGNPNQIGTFVFKIIAKNGNGQVTGLVELNVVSSKIIYHQNFTVETEQDFFFQINNETFSSELGQPFDLNYTLSSNPLPSWLNFSETTLMFKGQSNLTGNFPISIIASNANGTVTVNFVLNVVPKQREFQIISEDAQSFEFQVPDPSGGAFHYAAQQKSGAPLPAFITFDSTGLILSSNSTIEIRPQKVEVTVIGVDDSNQEQIRYDYTLIFSQKDTASSGSDVPLGAIIGGTIGGVVGLGIVVVIVVLIVLFVVKKFAGDKQPTNAGGIAF